MFKKSNVLLLIGLFMILGAGLILYSGHEIRANPDAFNDVEKLGTVFSNFAGIFGIPVGCLFMLMGWTQPVTGERS